MRELWYEGTHAHKWHVVRTVGCALRTHLGRMVLLRRLPNSHAPSCPQVRQGFNASAECAAGDVPVWADAVRHPQATRKPGSINMLPLAFWLFRTTGWPLSVLSQVRVMTVEQRFTGAPKRDYNESSDLRTMWLPVTRAALCEHGGGFSAVGWFFARKVRRLLAATPLTRARLPAATSGACYRTRASPEHKLSDQHAVGCSSSLINSPLSPTPTGPLGH